MLLLYAVFTIRHFGYYYLWREKHFISITNCADSKRVANKTAKIYIIFALQAFFVFAILLPEETPCSHKEVQNKKRQRLRAKNMKALRIFFLISKRYRKIIS